MSESDSRDRPNQIRPKFFWKDPLRIFSAPPGLDFEREKSRACGILISRETTMREGFIASGDSSERERKRA